MFYLSVPKNIDEVELGRRLRQLRVARGLSQGDLERRTGMSRCYISRIENGHTLPSLDTLVRWVGGLELELYQVFFKGKDAPEGARLVDADKLFSAVESELLNAFHSMSRHDRRMVLALLRRLAQPRTKKKRRRPPLARSEDSRVSTPQA